MLVTENVVDGGKEREQHDGHEGVLYQAEDAVQHRREVARREREVQPINERVQLVAEHEREQREDDEAEDCTLGSRTRLAERREIRVGHEHHRHPNQPELAIFAFLLLVAVFLRGWQVLNAK